MAEHILPLPPSHVRLTRIKTAVRDFLKARYGAYLNWRVTRVIARTERDTNAKCPACGHHNGEIRWASMMKWPDGSQGALVHQCKDCHAAWGEKPIVKADQWAITLSEQETALFAPQIKRA